MTPAITVFRSLWSRTRWVQVTVFACIALAYTGVWFADRQGLRSGSGDPSEDFVLALLLIGLPGLVGLATVLLANSDAERLYIALPPRVNRLPLKTWTIVVIQLTFGAGVTALLVLGGTLPALWLLNVDFPWWMPMLAAATITPLAQLWAFTFGNASPRSAIVSFFLYFGTLVWVAQRPAVVGFLSDGASGARFMAAAAFVAVVFGLAVAIVSVQRHGGWSFRMPKRAGARRTSRPLTPFASPRRAQFWYEWRQYGMLLPTYVGGVALAYFLGLPLVVGVFRISDVTGQSSNEPLFRIDWYTSAQFITTGLGIAAIIGSVIVGGIMFMRAGHWNSQSSYLLTRPLTLPKIANARTHVMFLSVVSALGVLLSLVGLMELITRLQGEMTGLGEFLYQGYEQLPPFYVYTVYWGGTALMMWTFAWSASYVYLLSTFAVLVAPPLAVIWAGALVGITDISVAQERTESLLPYLNWTAAIVVIVGLLAMAWRADSKRLLHPAIPWVSAALWLLYSSAFVYYANRWEVPITAREWVTRFPHPINWPLWVGASILPLVPLFLHPLMLERIRHR